MCFSHSRTWRARPVYFCLTRIGRLWKKNSKPLGPRTDHGRSTGNEHRATPRGPKSSIAKRIRDIRAKLAVLAAGAPPPPRPPCRSPRHRLRHRLPLQPLKPTRSLPGAGRGPPPPPAPASRRRAWPAVSAALFGAGFLLGPLLDGIHSRVGLQVYGNGALDVGPLHTHVLVPPLLGVLPHRRPAPPGHRREGAAQVQDHRERLDDGDVTALSAELYGAGVPSNVESYALFAGAEFAWLFLDGSWLGFALACLVGTVCPLAYIPLIKLLGCWSYPNADVHLFGEGLVSWTTTCYFVYTPFLANLARWLDARLAAADGGAGAEGDDGAAPS
ncbi:hypothetical protein C2845_PM07G04940 [Panicum miliaceum]|uniref:Uncharacterized protein n=1 Tax=Panicum miliaceum TaxID=4540 RepID=A0A3L6SQ27_PANMI|nr:hypothetical protein C2845_PM07G04940 [Panicum miliaceum]